MNTTNERDDAIKAYKDKKADLEASIAFYKAQIEKAQQEAAENEKSDGKKMLEHDEILEALRAAAAVKVRDYMLVDDIAEQAIRIPENITFGTMVDMAYEANADADAGEPLTDYRWSAMAAEWASDQADGLDSDAEEKIARQTRWLIQRCADNEIYPLDIL